MLFCRTQLAVAGLRGHKQGLLEAQALSSQRSHEGLQQRLWIALLHTEMDSQLIGLLYKAHPDGCQHRLHILLRLRPCPMRGHQPLCVLHTQPQLVNLHLACFRHWPSIQTHLASYFANLELQGTGKAKGFLLRRGPVCGMTTSDIRND